ncbi:MAG: prepilin peptidase [Phycisphaeraceae bacterium]|nr:prepilin peptidase [Phycisphaeraceae bacterium]
MLVMELWPWMVLVVVLGACVGSFLNVVIYRLPAGQSLLRPASHCPRCQTALRWFENVPVLAWFYLKGRCRYCGAKISFQYPLIEMLTAGLFGAVFFVLYATDWRFPFANVGLEGTWPALVVILFLVGSLIAASVIDGRYFIIPLEIPWLAAGLAMLMLPAATLGLSAADAKAILPYVDRWDAAAGIWAATVGLVLANLLLWWGVLPRSFEEGESSPAAGGPAQGEQLTGQEGPGDSQTAGDPEPAAGGEKIEAINLAAHPHTRAEVLKELLFLALPALSGIAAWWGANQSGWGGQDARTVYPWLGVASGVMWGFLVGGGLVWVTRILGTLAFGREAMGLGDVHLLAAVGAVLGAGDVIGVFFLAPFLALGGTAVVSGIRKLIKGDVRIIPYGPYLAVTALGFILFRGLILQVLFGMLFRGR